MGAPLAALLLALPLIEIGLFVTVGAWMGLWPTLLVVIATAAGGVAIIRHVGTATFGRLRAELARGGDPAGPLADGVLLLMAGFLLLAPGFFTDALGLLLLLPPVRKLLVRLGGPRMAMRIRRAGPRGTVIDGTFEVVDPGEAPPAGPSGWTLGPPRGRP